MSRRVRVAIIGGGCAALTTAFELTRPEQRGRYEVTVYQLGWRLGGKGASGRGVFDRIEEHGLHLWMGFYENAFQVLSECYAELARDPLACRIATLDDAFSPCAVTSLADFGDGRRDAFWAARLPATPGRPGEPASCTWSIATYLARCLDLVRSLLASVEPQASPEAHAGEGGRTRIQTLLGYGELGTWTALREALALLGAGLEAMAADETLLRLHAQIRDAVARRIAQRVKNQPALRRLWEIVDLVLAVVRGCLRFGLLNDPRGFDAIDEYDCRDWLLHNGAERASLDSAFVRALYNLAFAFEGGDPARPRIAAGQALRGALRAFFTYRGAFFWRMNAGMGDVVFTPLYQVLRRRGVRFAFFHRLDNVVLGKGRAGKHLYVSALELSVQARVRGGREYEPLIDVAGLPCWPAAPRFEQLVEGEALRARLHALEHADPRGAGTRHVLHVGRDFDCVVLGVGVGAVASVTQELAARDPLWHAMLDNTASVATQAFQLWLRPSTRELGWPHAHANLSGFVEPFDTWADMTHLRAQERWPEAPGSIAYFCSVLPDGAGSPAARAAEVRDNAIRFLERDVSWLWPNARAANGGFRWQLLLDPRRGSGKAHAFDSQYWRANVHTTDRYALSLPGSLRHRISPLDDTYDNLTVCGDWTGCGFEEGCVEAAVMSGRLAAHALSGSPSLAAIIGYDHP